MEDKKVEKGFFGTKYLYLDEKTRVRYGISFNYMGITYTLQRKKIFWKEVAWTYPSTHIGDNINEIIRYLKWYEEEENKSTIKCLF